MAKRHKAYHPRPVNPFGGLVAIDRKNRIDELSAPLTDEQIANLGICYRVAYQCMVDGNASEENWATIVSALNVSLTLAERGIGDEYIQAINRALAGAWRAKLREDQGKGWGFDGESQQAIKFALEIADAQCESAPKFALIQAIQSVRDKIERGETYQEEK
jgi:hypothetical protein